MKVLHLLAISSVAYFACARAAEAAYNPQMASYIYHHAKNKNKLYLSSLKRDGKSLDATDDQGNTALCKAILDEDKNTYEMLKDYGADTSHPCVKKAMAVHDKAGFPNYNSNYTLGTGAVAAAAAGIVGAAFGSSGGSGGAGSGGDSGGGGIDPSLEPTVPGDFETEEYAEGNFLSQIKASQAYARYYYKDTEGKLVAPEMERVRVGIVDSGVYSDNIEFAGKNIIGFNFDYGPCQNGNTENCWTYNETLGRAQAVINGNTHSSLISKEDFDERMADYPSDYDWASQQGNFHPFEGVDNAHGTKMAGIIVGNKGDAGMHGVAFDNADLVVARYDFLSGLNDPTIKLIESGARIINYSLGTEASALLNASLLESMPDRLDYNYSMYRKAAETNTVLVFATGNDGYTEANILAGAPLIDEFASGGTSSLENLFIAVTALNAAGDNIADFANHCGVTKNFCITAPGSDVVSSNSDADGYLVGSGTSQATAVTTGSVAFLMGAYPYMTSQEVVALMFETATDLGDEGIDEIYGNGLINLDEATKPQEGIGGLSIATSSSVNGSMMSTAASRIAVPGVFQNALIKNNNASIAVFDKYKRPYQMPLSSFMRATNNERQNFRNDVFAFSKRRPTRVSAPGSSLSFGFTPSTQVGKKSDIGMGLMDLQYKGKNSDFRFYYTENTKYGSDVYFDQSTYNPFMAMNNAYGMESSHSFGPDFRIKTSLAFGENGLYDGSFDYNDPTFENSAYAFSNELSFNVAKHLSLSAIGGSLFEDGAALGLNGTGAFGLGNARTNYLGMAFSWNYLQNFTLYGVYYQGWTQAQNSAASLMDMSDLVSDSFAIDGRYRFNRGTDVIGMQISSPLRINRGTASFDLPVGRDDYSNQVYRRKFSASMRPDARELKLSLYHMKEVDESLSFKSEVDVRLNPGHQKGAETDYRAMFGLNLDL